MAEEEDVLIREIDDELKQENLQKLWNDYGVYMLGAAVALVIGVAGFKGWQAYDMNQRTELSERFAAAQKLAEGGKTEAARAAFGAITADGGAGYAMLARFQMAALMAKNGDTAGAAGAYAAIAGDGGVKPVYQELAVVLGALSELDSKSRDGGLLARAQKLAAGTGPWRFSAKEISALEALYGGDNKKAREYYGELAKAADAPQGLRARAREMELILQGK